MLNAFSKSRYWPIDKKSRYKESVPFGPLWSVVSTIVIIVLPQVFALLAFEVLFHILKWKPSYANNWFNNSVIGQFSYVLIIEIQSLTLIALALKYKAAHFMSIGLVRFRSKDILYTLNGFLVYIAIFYAISTLAGKLISGFDANQKQNVGFQSAHGTVPLLITFVSLVILPPIAEEIIFRGYLFSGLRTKIKFIYAAIITSALFAVPHLLEGQSGGTLWIAGLDTFVLSMVLCYLREKTKSLWPGIMLHALKNGLAFAALFFIL